MSGRLLERPLKRARVDALRSCLKKHKVTTAEELAAKTEIELMDILTQSLDGARDALDLLRERISGPELSCLDLLEEESNCLAGDHHHLSFGLCPDLDIALGGGLKIGTIIELAGCAGSGKTQLCMWLSARTALGTLVDNASDVAGFTGNGIVYFDTEGTFESRRFCNFVAGAVPLPWKKQVVARATARTHVFEVTSAVDLLQHLASPSFSDMIVSKNIRLIIVDSVAALVGSYKDARNVKGGVLGKIAANLKQLGSLHGLTVLVTNHVARYSSDKADIGVGTSANAEQRIVPQLGRHWAHFVNTRIILTSNSANVGKGMISVAKSPVCRKVFFAYEIGSNIISAEPVEDDAKTDHWMPSKNK